MYQVNYLQIVSRIAKVALEANRIVILDTDDTKVDYPGSQFAAKLFGVTIEAADIGKQVDVCILGCAEVKVDGAASNIVAGDFIVAHEASTGLGQKIGNTANTAYAVIGKAIGAATADGALLPIVVMPTTITPNPT